MMRSRFTRAAPLFVIAALTNAGCATTKAKSTKNKQQARPKVEEDYTLGATGADLGETRYFLSRDGLESELPSFVFSPSAEGDESDNALFPVAEGSIDTAIGPVPVEVGVYVVAEDETRVRIRPEEEAGVVHVLPRGKRFAAVVEDGWARIGKDQYVDRAALTVDERASERLQSKLLGVGAPKRTGF